MIYLPNTTGEEKTFFDILSLLYDKRRSNYSLVPTYSDKECTIQECTSGRRRSFQALAEIARTYFPEITLKEFCDTLEKKELKFYYCRDVKKVVFHFVPGKTPFTGLVKLLYFLESSFDKCRDELIKFLEENFNYNTLKQLQ